MSSERSNFITIKKVQSFGHASTSLCQRENMAWIFLWYDSQTSYLFFFSSQNATARMMRTPRMLAITTDTTKPKKRGKTCTSVNTTALSGEGESVICHNACILHQQPFHSLVTPRCGCAWAALHRCSLECPSPTAGSTAHSAVIWCTCWSHNANVEALLQQVIAGVGFLCYNKLELINKPKELNPGNQGC